MNAANQSRMSRNAWIIKRIVGFAEITAALAMLGSFAALFGQFHFLLDLCTHFRLQAIMGLLVCGPILIFIAKRRRFGLTSLAIGLGLLMTLLPYFVGTPSSGDGPGFRLMSFNVLTSNQSKEAVGNYILSQDPDVVILFEVNSVWDIALKKFLSERYPHCIAQTREDNFGIAAFTKKAPVAAEVINVGNDGVPSVNLQYDSFRVIGTHPVPPMSPGYWLARNNQFDELAELVANSDVPTIVCGDLNSGPWSPFMKKFLVTADLEDSAMGFGIWPTWYSFGGLIGLPIDHVFQTKELKVQSRRVGPNLGSDHRAVIVDFANPKTVRD